MKISDLRPGRELDAVIHEQVMGQNLITPCDGDIGELPISSDGWLCMECGHTGYLGSDTAHHRRVPDYSTDIATAWQVVEKITEPPGNRASADANVVFATLFDNASMWAMKSSEAAAAICLAALKAVGAIK